MTEISKEQVKNAAQAARLIFTEDEVEKLSKELTTIFEFADQLNEVDTNNVEPTTHVIDIKNVMRKDEPKQTITREEAFKNAPDAKDGYFRVPSILE